MTQGYLTLVLHAHLPYVRHPEHARFLEEDWFFEAMTETYSHRRAHRRPHARALRAARALAPSLAKPESVPAPPDPAAPTTPG
jgi:hypothetical protein